MTAPESVVKAVMDALWCDDLHMHGRAAQPDCCPHPDRAADAAFAASLEWAASSMLHTCTCHPSDDDSAHCVSPVARQLRYWARGDR